MVTVCLIGGTKMKEMMANWISMISKWVEHSPTATNVDGPVKVVTPVDTSMRHYTAYLLNLDSTTDN